MSWSIGYDTRWKRDIGYGVPAICDYPSCNARIDRGLAFVCSGEPYGGEHGCGLYFCEQHHSAADQLCDQCADGLPPFEAKPDTEEWTRFKMTDDSWAEWRAREKQKGPNP